MVESANILGVLAGALLLTAVIAWANLLRGPQLQRTDGSNLESARGEVVIELLFWAVGLSIAAAALALTGLIFE